MPQRIQRKRTGGWKLSKGAVIVTRPTKWGNPFRVGEVVADELMPYLAQWYRLGGRLDALVGMSKIRLMDAEDVVSLYDFWISQQPHLMVSLDELRGRDLCCYCRLDQPCHADVLLELANPETDA